MKKNIMLGITLLLISIVLIIIKNNDNYVEGRVIDISDNKSILIHKNNEPILINFKDNINNIVLNDIVKVKTDGIVRESFPVQMTGISIKKVRNEYKKLNENIESISFKTDYYQESLVYKNKFKTTVFKNKEGFKDYVEKSRIALSDSVDNIYKEYFAVVSTTSMSSGGILSFEGLYQKSNNISINLKLNIREVQTTDIVTRGNIILISKKYIDYNFETLSETKKDEH